MAENETKEVVITSEESEDMSNTVRIEEDTLFQKEVNNLNNRGKRTLKNSAMAALSIAGEAAAAAAGMPVCVLIFLSSVGVLSF